MSRRVDAALLWRVTANTLGRMACEHADPSRDGHDHRACLRDDEAYAADLVLGLIAAVVSGRQDDALDELTDLFDTVGLSSA